MISKTTPEAIIAEASDAASAARRPGARSFSAENCRANARFGKCRYEL